MKTFSQALEAILLQSHNHVRQLLHILKNESIALAENDISILEANTLEKLQLTEKIESVEQQRNKFLAENGYNPSEPAQWLIDNKLISIWSEIKSLSQQAQKQNQVNGIVINNNRRRIQTQIEILSSSAPAVELVYSASGENIKQRDSNTLAHV